MIFLKVYAAEVKTLRIVQFFKKNQNLTFNKTNKIKTLGFLVHGQI